MACSFDQESALQIRYDLRQLLNCTRANRHANHAISRTCDEKGGLLDHCSMPRRCEFPVGIDVAVPVEPAPEAGALKLRGHHMDVRIGEPCRQLFGIDTFFEKPLSRLQDHRQLAPASIT